MNSTKTLRVFEGGNNMSKVVWKPGTFVYPIPAVLVSCGNMDKSNIITVAWTGILNTNPAKVYISVRPERYSYNIIKETNFESTKDLRDLMQKYINMRKYPTVRPLTPPNVVNILLDRTTNIDGVPFEIQFSTIPEKKITGNAKNWCLLDDNHLVVLSRSQYNKQLEGIVEGFVHSRMRRKNYNTSFFR